MPRSTDELSPADICELLREIGDWMDTANHAQTEIEWRIELLKAALPPGDPDLLKLMNAEKGRKH